MKKILFLSISLFFAGSFLPISAEEITMPTDKEIMQVIKQYGFDPSQEEVLLKETKKQLQQQLNSSGLLDLLNSIEEDGYDGEDEGEDGDKNSKPNKKKYANHDPYMKKQSGSSSGKKKYANHDPLTRRSKQ